MEISGRRVSMANKTDMEKCSSDHIVTYPRIHLSPPVGSMSDLERSNNNSPVSPRAPSSPVMCRLSTPAESISCSERSNSNSSLGYTHASPAGRLFKPIPYRRHGESSSPYPEEVLELALDVKPIGSATDPHHVLHSIVNVNRTLQNRIEALRLRLSFQAEHNDEEKRSIELQNTNILQAKDAEIEALLKSIEYKDREIGDLVEGKRKKDRTIEDKIKEIENLKLLVQQTETYTDKLQTKMDRLKDDKRALESDEVYRKQREEIIRLRHELKTLHSNIQTMEYDIIRAKSIIHAQGMKIRGLERDNIELANTFKDQLEKATTAIHQEVGQMREIMGTQWEEMKGFCKQNKDMHSDLTLIKDHLINQSADMTAFNNHVPVGSTRLLRKGETNMARCVKSAHASGVASGSRLSNSEIQHSGKIAMSKELPTISQSSKAMTSRANAAWRHPSSTSKSSQKKS